MESNLNNFLGQDNTQMLWGVLIDELNIKRDNNINYNQLITNIQTIFNTNLNLFRDKANMSQSIMSLNKQFLQQVIVAINQLVPNLKEEQSFKSIKIGEYVSEPYNIEDIHTKRQTDFEKKVAQKQNELDSIINVKKPEPVNFSDNIKDEKIVQMDLLISETMARRNFEVEQIQNNNYNTNNVNPETWLNPQETNVSLQKIKPEYVQQKNNNTSYINLLTNQQSETNPKKVSWDENTIISQTYVDTNQQTDIFLKLKRGPGPTETELLKEEIQLLKDQISKINEKLDKFIENK